MFSKTHSRFIELQNVIHGIFIKFSKFLRCICKSFDLRKCESVRIECSEKYSIKSERHICIYDFFIFLKGILRYSKKCSDLLKFSDDVFDSSFLVLFIYPFYPVSNHLIRISRLIYSIFIMQSLITIQ